MTCKSNNGGCHSIREAKSKVKRHIHSTMCSNTYATQVFCRITQLGLDFVSHNI